MARARSAAYQRGVRRDVTLVCVITLAVAACRGDPGAGMARGRADGSATIGGGGAGGGASDAGTGAPADAAARWATLCASCHGGAGEGGTAPAVDRWTRSRAELVGIIDARMPVGAPEACVGSCAEDLADHVLGALQRGDTPEPPVDACATPRLAPRQLRLLTRREWLRSVRDALGSPPARSCAALSDCALEREHCAAGTCAADPCSLRTFVYDPRGRSHRQLVVAGSFNGWDPNAGGDWRMQFVPGPDVWVAKATLADGEHAYKFVADGSEWITDPTNPRTAPDGVGGSNSILAVSCAGAPAPGGAVSIDDATAAFPPETRPSGYFFDNEAGSGIVTSVHVTEHLAAGERLAAQLAPTMASRLGCDPARDRAGCTERFVSTVGRRLFRRSLTAAERERHASQIASEARFEDGVALALRAMLVSPSFLYRSELGAPQADGSFRLTGVETASLLAYTLWGTAPDEALIDLAEAGGLDTEDGVEAAARRLLEDPRARDQLGHFAVQWLGAEKILTVDKHAGQFPDFDGALRRALLEETRRLVTHVVFDGPGTVEALLTADYTFADRRTAALYELPAPAADFDRVPYAHGRRAGVLGHAAVLGTYAYSDQSAPVQRGLFVRARLLCQELPQPPANAGGIPEVDPNATTRERFAQHSSDPACRACHRYIDGVGFGFERFDAIGRWRERENGVAVDSSGNMNDVERLGSNTDAPYATLPELARILADSRRARTCFATQYYRYARGGRDGEPDACALQRATERYAAEGWDIKTLMIAVARSSAFLGRAP